MSGAVIIDHRLAILRGIPGCLIVLIDRIADQSPKDASCSQSDKGALSIAPDGLSNESACAGPYRSPDLGVVSAVRIVHARSKQERQRQR